MFMDALWLGALPGLAHQFIGAFIGAVTVLVDFRSS
eukprot:COSAG06_NODE_1970_length_7941_cov_5.832568_1_plen_35_part_10